MELYPIEEAQAPTAEWHREERLHGRGGGTLHCRRDRGRDEFGSKIFFRASVYAGATPEIRQLAPHGCWTERVSSAPETCFCPATVDTLSPGF